MKNKTDKQKLKEDICDALNNRKQNIEKVVHIFFGPKIDRKITRKKYEKIYKSVVTNLNKMDDFELDNVARKIELL